MIQMINGISNLYGEEFKSRGLYPTIAIDREGSDRFVDALRSGTRAYLMFSKPFLLEMNAQPGLLPVFVCHEIGHLLANDISSDDSVSPEGEADYFAGADCLKRVLKSHSDYFDAGVKFTALAKRFGDYLYQNVDHSKIYTSNRPSPHRTETITVGETIFGHPYPSLQCRLDSLIAGLNCAKSRFEIVNGRMAWISCNQNSPESSKAKNIKNDGMFPRCWYHP